MKHLKLFFIPVLLFISAMVNAQRISIEEYVGMYKELAIEEMKRTGVPASITLAQGILETENGNSQLVKESNNHFGIKCKEDWKGPTVRHTDDAPWECFRKYSSAEESYKDHSDFLRSRKHYSSLFNLDPSDYKAWAYGLKKAGYATNPQYAQQLIKYIETYNLQQYSLIALGRLPKQEVAFSETKDSVAATVGSEQVAQLSKSDVEQNKTEAIPQNESNAVVYPFGEFKINNAKVIFVRAGISLLAIAERYKISLADLLDFNDLKDSDVLEKDQLIFLQRKRRRGVNRVHIVKANENLYEIAQMEGIQLKALLQYNLLSDSFKQPEIGESLNLQSVAVQMPKLKEVEDNISSEDLSNSTIKTKVHVVAAKETLYSISKKYNVPVNQLINWNRMKGYTVKTGQELIISK
ncbi:MAG TPA: glucosaminidase domain-containing protein [Chitinophagaceae bacterium]|nr:glucosaminidase domain-containing protein [Chitinophagaceae bacterium]